MSIENKSRHISAIKTHSGLYYVRWSLDVIYAYYAFQAHALIIFNQYRLSRRYANSYLGQNDAYLISCRVLTSVRYFSIIYSARDTYAYTCIYSNDA